MLTTAASAGLPPGSGDRTAAGAVPPGHRSSGWLTAPGQAEAGRTTADGRTAVGPQALTPVASQAVGLSVGQEAAPGPPGTGQPVVLPGQRYLVPPTPAPAMTGRPTLGAAGAPTPAAGLHIGTIEVTVLAPPVAATRPQPARPAVARPSRPQPPPRLTRGYGPGFGQERG